MTREGRGVDLVRGVSFTVMPGEILGLVGESGAGKSMMGTAVTGLLDRPLAITAGEILYRGRRIDNLPPSELRALRGRHIATIFQDPLTALNPVFSVERQLVETIEAHTPLRGPAARDEAVALLARVGIPAPEKRLASYPHEFSGGMRQRVVIALALAGRPELIIADEPTTALDVSVQGQIIELLRDLCAERGMAVILVTHDMGVIATLAHRVAVAYAGRIVEIGPVAEVVRHPRHPYTRGLMAAIPAIGTRLKRLTQIPGAMPRPDAVPPGCAFAPRCPLAEPRCSQGLPPDWVEGNHRAACWRAGEGSDTR
ncbi:ABC transporter ATP-binding protein [uncultured Alsobacter sp.]|uniref:ABC transporter ATP-binding protein n=1 Tax=uncultured Alsobacter sp. TaxID=1748258 RepID=UPI0025E765F8|nr:ABC transporter ATP-binding protein [uncultured Alsobacter sp.]